MTAPRDICLIVFALQPDPADIGLLAADEYARMQRLRLPRDQAWFAAARAGLRRVLAGVLRCAPADVQFVYGPAGKPFVQAGVEFNLSHSDGFAALAIAAYPIGVDVERVRPIEPDLAPRFFAPEEAAALARLPPAAYLAGFYACWTRKEAVLKARGDGLQFPLDGFAVSLDAPPRLLWQHGDRDAAACWHLRDFVPAPGLVGALAARHPIGAVRLMDLAAASVPGAVQV